MHPLIAELIAAQPGHYRRRLGHPASGTRPGGRGLPRRLEPLPPGAGRGGRPGLRRGRQPDHPHQHLRRQPLHARPARAGRQGGRDQPRRGRDLPPRGRPDAPRSSPRSGPSGVMLMMGEVQPRERPGGLCRTGRGHRRRRGRRDRPRNHLRSRRDRAGRRRRQADRPAGGRLHDLRLRQGPRPHAHGHHARTGRREALPRPGPM